jgi:aldose 1-epimerase
VLDFEARCDSATTINLTNHAYFNLKGEGSGTILDYDIQINSARILETDLELMPTGKLKSVSGTPYDFQSQRTIGDVIDQNGFDRCFVIDRDGEGLSSCASVREPKTGRVLEVFSTLPGPHFYTDNFLSRKVGKRGAIYPRHSEFCLEAQFFPDSPKVPDFPTTILRLGQTWKHAIVYHFEI